MYPTDDERIAIVQAEELMKVTMAKYDPSHDAYHGESLSVSFSSYLR
jgi:uncharacterized protein